MKAERWQRLKELLNAALERDELQRSAFLNEHCAGDPELREELDSLLRSWQEADDFMEEESPGTSDTSPRVAAPEVRIGAYRVLEEIGRGGMGTVYKAIRTDDLARQPVAVKIVRRGMDHEFIVRRFRNERTILGALDHPNIARLIDGGVTPDGLPYFVMEYVEGGQTILEYCDANCLGTAERLRLFVLVCSAVQAAHDRRVVHRDIKPGNILIDSKGQPKLLDFGIAKILDPDLTTQTIEVTATVLRLMTPEYASPEQVRGGEIGAPSDVYSLGVLLYELLTGHRPYRLRSKGPHEIAQVICEEAPERPSTMVGRTELITRTEGAVTVTPMTISSARKTDPAKLRRSLMGELDNIILMAMRKEPDRRYRSAAALADDIERHLDGRPIRARRDTMWYRASRVVERHRTRVAASLAALLLGSTLVLAWRDFARPASEPVTQLRRFPLTSFPGDETQPAFSPDGTRVAFVWEGENSDNSDIYMKPTKGVGLERLTTNAAEDLSPTWSPDGKRLAWLRTTPEQTGIFVSPADPGEMHSQITKVYPNRIEAVGRHLDWSPDGLSLAAADKNSDDEPFRIVSVELATGNKRPLTNPPSGTVGDSNPVYSPDGKSIAFIRGVGSGVDDVFIQSLGGGEARRLTDDKRFIISLSWSADGKHLLFSSDRAGSHSLWRVPSTGGKPERIANVGENVSDPVISRDGKLLAYSQFYQDTNIWQLDLQTLTRRKVIASTQFDSSPSFSADSSKIAFRSSRSGTHEVWIADSDGTDERQVTHMGNSLSGSPRFSPDGKRIAFDSRPDGQPDIFVIDTDGSHLQRITSEESEDVCPNWSLDGKWLYFASNRSGTWQVWKVPSAGGTPIQVTHGGGFVARESPDGKWIYYARGRSVNGLWRVRVDGTGEEAVTDRLKPGFWAYWAVTRQGVYFVDRDAARSVYALYLLTEARREPQRVVDLERPIITGDQGLAASTDGRTLLYAQIDQSGSDILMVELR